MSIPKTVKDFANNIDLLVSDLQVAGFQKNDQSILEKNKSFHVASKDFVYIMSDPISFLAVVFPNFTKSEIRQLVSFLSFMRNIVIGHKINQEDAILFTVENNHQGFMISSTIFCLNINDGVLAIRGEFFNNGLLKPLDVEFHDIMYTLKKFFKGNITFYFEDVLEINTALINTMITETVSDYFWRKNNSNILKHLSDNDFINQLIELGKANMVNSKVSALKIMHHYNEINLQQLYDQSYVDGVKSDMETATNFIFKFKYQELRQMRSFFEKMMTSESIDNIFQIIDLYVFKQKIHGLFRESDTIQVFRSNFNKHQKNSLPFLTGLCIQMCGLTIDFTDRVQLSDNICDGSDKIVSDNLYYVEKAYKFSLIKHLEQKFEMSSQEITNKSLIVYQMAVI